jgi:hypothetical protein
MSHPDEGKGLRSESEQRFVKLTDAAVERVELRSHPTCGGYSGDVS